ncbi:MAG: NAD(P)/FAD-dependent oxidoreductase [Elusimicrobiota bacterium]|nr:NAD(P)/FAD-dependent oxidoreductase [Elusimicrobiota bacterium]
MAATQRVQVLVVGAGPAGSAMAAYLARASLSCLVVEAETFPRPHVGESLVPSSNRVFREIGFLDEMLASDFVVKHGAAWTLPRGARFGVEFAERPQPGVEESHTWHVDRARFDMMLARHARAQGAEVRFGAAVKSVSIDAGGVDAELSDGSRVRAELLVDASGRRTFYGAARGLKVMDPVFDQFAVHAWFEGFDRGPVTPEHIFIHFLEDPGSWVWQIPITKGVTSVGLVMPKARLQGRAGDPAALFREMVSRHPDLARRVDAARRANEFKVEAEYSYEMKAFCGDRFVLIGDAARFVDPIFSSGVSIALNGARLAARDAVDAFKTGDLSRASFARFERTLRTGTRNWKRFIQVYYALNALFTWFIAKEEYRGPILQLLQGDVYDETVPVLDELEALIRRIAADPGHLWHAQLDARFTAL